MPVILFNFAKLHGISMLCDGISRQIFRPAGRDSRPVGWDSYPAGRDFRPMGRDSHPAGWDMGLLTFPRSVL